MTNPNPPPEDVEERRARELAETVKSEASGVSDTVRTEAGGITDHAEKQAADLAAERIIQRTEERSEQRADIKSELSDITLAMGALMQHMDKSLPEERVQEILATAKREERHSRRRLLAAILGPLVIAIIAGAGAWMQAASNGDQNAKILVLSKDAKVVADYVQHCLQGHTEGFTPEQLKAECGNGDAAQAFFVTYLNCALKIVPADRTDKNLNDCVQQGAAAAGGQ